MIASFAIFALLAAGTAVQEECVENLENQEQVVVIEEESEEVVATLNNEEEDSEYQDLAFFEEESEIPEDLVSAEEE